MQEQDTGRTIAGLILVGTGGLFLLAQGTGFNFFGLMWPLFVLIPGAIFLTLALRGQDDKTVGFIFPGVVVTGTGLILAYQNFTGHWESWAYIWTLYPVFVGVALRYVSHQTQNADAGRVGRMMVLGGMVAFVGLAALFELFIFNGVSLGGLAPVLPILMMGAGLFLLFRSASTSQKSKRKSHEI